MYCGRQTALIPGTLQLLPNQPFTYTQAPKKGFGIFFLKSRTTSLLGTYLGPSQGITSRNNQESRLFLPIPATGEAVNELPKSRAQSNKED